MNREEEPLSASRSSSTRAASTSTATTHQYRSLDHQYYDEDDPHAMEDAEDAILSNLEAQSRRTTALSDGFRPARVGERPPLGVASVGTGWTTNDPDDDDDDGAPTSTATTTTTTAPPSPRRTFHQMARNVQHVTQLGSRRPPTAAATTNRSSSRSRSWRDRGGSTTRFMDGSRKAHNLLASIEEVTTGTYYQQEAADEFQNNDGGNDDNDDYYVSPTKKDASHELFTNFHKDLFSVDPRPHHPRHEGLAFLWNKGDDKEGVPPPPAPVISNPAPTETMATKNTSPEQRPLLGRTKGSNHNGADGPLEDTMSSLRRMEQRRQPPAHARARDHRMKKRLMNCWNPFKMLQRILYVLRRSTLVISIPCFGMAWCLFYYVDNPKLDFMPGSATISWWLNFLGRQLLVFEMAHFTQFLWIDLMIMSSKKVVQVLGPWVTIFFLQSKGWPFLITCWGIYDMVLLHGDNNFQQHWLYWTGIKIYSQANSGSYILSSSVYLRVLIGMELTGVATTFKRTLLTIYFGKRNFDIYKPKLEEILHEIIVITEIAELGAEADDLRNDDDGDDDDDNGVTRALLEDHRVEGSRGREVGIVRWSSVKFNEKERTDSADGVVVDSMDASPTVDDVQKTAEEDSPMRSQRASTSYKSGSSGVIKIKNLLDRWEEPVNKLDKTTDSTVDDILKFRKALTYMDLDHPFGGAFGPASTRDELIKSAQVLYQRLLKLSPGSNCLPYSVLAVLSENQDGSVDPAMKKSITNLFRADANGEIPMLAFIQNCDVVYRRLRYFRASVGNSSVIDRVLENIINGFFVFGLAVVILSLLNFDPWPLLVSVSTLLVSFAFAIGPTAAKAIEGIILIAGTRPFDIGDRIIIANSPGQPTAGVSDSWFVEDITLFSTTLRLAANNEVATVSNGTISGTRITNCARSKNAVVSIIMKLHISLHDGKNARMFKDAVENYISNNPAVWDSLVYLRCEDINSDDECVMYHLAVRSRHSWQVAARILSERGRLHQFCTDLAKELKVNFDSPTSRRVFYYGGNLVDGAVKDFKKNLLMDRNNISMGSPDAFFGSKGNLHRGTSAAAPHHSTIEEADGEGTMPSSDNAADDMFLAMVNQSQE